MGTQPRGQGAGQRSAGSREAAIGQATQRRQRRRTCIVHQSGAAASKVGGHSLKQSVGGCRLGQVAPDSLHLHAMRSAQLCRRRICRRCVAVVP